MSLLGIDVGTTGCKAAAFSKAGELLASAYREYDIRRPQSGWAELDPEEVWQAVREVIAEAAARTQGDPVTALAVASLGEAVVPVGRDGEILGPSILNFDERGAEYIEPLSGKLPDEHLYRVNGNTLGNHYGLTKLMWLRDHASRVYENADKCLLWGAFVSVMLGAEPVVDYSLANRTLLFDVDQAAWSDELIDWAGLDESKLPDTAPSGAVIGEVRAALAAELGLPPGVAIATGAHDQCANAVGCGVLAEGDAMFGMGTYFCILPVFSERRAPSVMMAHGLNTEHHAAPDRFACFIYNHGGSLLKWHRDTFAAADCEVARQSGRDLYADLIAEAPEGPSSVMVLPHFSTTGPPEFIADSSGVMAGLRLETTRGDVLKGIFEGTLFYLRECLEALPEAGIAIEHFRAVGGGSKSDTWLQVCADILGRPLTRVKVAEAGALGAAILAGAATGVFQSVEEGADVMVGTERIFEPDSASQTQYDVRFGKYRNLWPLMKKYLREL